VREHTAGRDGAGPCVPLHPVFLPRWSRVTWPWVRRPAANCCNHTTNYGDLMQHYVRYSANQWLADRLWHSLRVATRAHPRYGRSAWAVSRAAQQCRGLSTQCSGPSLQCRRLQFRIQKTTFSEGGEVTQYLRFPRFTTLLHARTCGATRVRILVYGSFSGSSAVSVPAVQSKGYAGGQSRRVPRFHLWCHLGQRQGQAAVCW
jgi:hypothetical protein